ncbi:MAG: hypothetical protein AAGF12_18805 [Myxococcota bacterium]
MRSLILSTLALCLLLACDEEETITTDDTTPIVGTLELPISHRHQDSEPSGGARVEISPTEFRLEGQKLFDMTGGYVPDGEHADGLIGKVRDSLQSGPARSSARVRLHANTPYQTLAFMMKTLKAANVNTVGFEVRAPNTTSSSGWLVVTSYDVTDANADPVEMPGQYQRRWADWVAGWEAAYTGCRRDHYVDCTHHTANTPSDGNLELRFFARGQALKVEFRRFGGETVEETTPTPAAMLDGVPAPVPAAEEEGPPPLEHGAFTWRFEAATEELSPIKDAMRPLCGAQPCGFVQTGDVQTMSMRLISLWGAAFSDGTESPHIAFHIPTR